MGDHLFGLNAREANFIKELKEKQKRFVEEYLVDLNATNAAIRAGYSKKTAYSQGSRLLKSDEVKRQIQQKREEFSQNLTRTAEDIVKDIQSVTQEAIKKGQLVSALKGLELECKLRGMFKEDKDGVDMNIRIVREVISGRD